jgi:hypothetical protein
MDEIAKVKYLIAIDFLQVYRPIAAQRDGFQHGQGGGGDFDLVLPSLAEIGPEIR